MEMAQSPYDAVLQAIERLRPVDQQRLAAELAGRIPNGAGEEARPHSILELRGLGKEVWAGVDPDEHVDQERSSWSG